MKKQVIAMAVAGALAGGMAINAQADTVTVSGGTVNFVGQVVNAACSVAADSVDQTVTLSGAYRQADNGRHAGQPERRF